MAIEGRCRVALAYIMLLLTYASSQIARPFKGLR